ncbi:MAG: acetyl-CoA carboxylase biotin carboxyl carrier protein [Solirubrobacteraceae bacterium]
MPLSDDDIREILRIIDESELDELQIETSGFSLHVSRGSAGTAASSGTARVTHAVDEEAAARAAGEPNDAFATIPSPMLGTFYRGQAPGAAPFVEVGSRVEPDSTVCIVEVMKMMNSVPAGVAGTIAEILPVNGQLVEYGEALFRVQADA